MLYDSDIGYDVSNKKENRTRGYSIFSVSLFSWSFVKKYILPKLCLDLLKEVILPSEIGFTNTNQRC